MAFSNGMRIGVVEPRVAARLLKLIADGNKYVAGVTTLGAQDVRIIIREIYQDPRNYGKVSFPTAAKSTDLRPYTKGTLVREDEEIEEDLEDDIEDEEITDLDRVLPPEDHHRRSLHRRDRRDRRAVAPDRDRSAGADRGQLNRTCDNPGRWWGRCSCRAPSLGSRCPRSSGLRRRRRAS